MLYYILKVIVNIFYRVFYKIQVRNIHYVNSEKATVLSVNHSNAFIDPTILGMLTKKKVRFFARGDVFRKKMVRRALESLNISPMFRMQEGGFSEVRKNDKTFEECKKLLSENKNVMLFPEAICVQERRIRKLKKGLTRIVFMTEEEFDFKKDVMIAPVGLNYSNPSKIRSKVFIDFGKPFSLKDFELKYKQDKVKTINEFTAFLQKKMEELVVVIDNPENDQLVGEIEKIYMYEWLKDEECKNADLCAETEVSKKIAGMVNYFDKNSPERISSIKQKIIPYTAKLNSLRLRDHLFRKESIEGMSGWTFFFDFLLIWFGMPCFFIGMLMNYPPYFFAKKFADKKVKNIEFYSSVHANLAWILWFPWYGLQLLAIALLFRSWLLLAIYSVLVPVLFIYIIHYYPVMKKIFGRWRLLRLVRKNKNEIEKLMITREEIISELDEMKNIFLETKINP